MKISLSSIKNRPDWDLVLEGTVSVLRSLVKFSKNRPEPWVGHLWQVSDGDWGYKVVGTRTGRILEEGTGSLDEAFRRIGG